MADVLETRLLQAQTEQMAPIDLLARAHLLIIDDLGMRKLPTPPPRTCSSWSCAITSGPPRCSPPTARSTSGGKLLGDTAAVTALFDRLLHHAHVLKCGPRSWRIKVQTSAGGATDELRHG